MLRLGLTGGIGAGKSTVARRLTELGAVLVDSDAIAREVVAPGSDGLAAVVAEFGDGVIADDGSLDRPSLAAVAFADDVSRARLNAVLHPRIGARTAELVAAAPPDSIVVQDVPLLVENGMAPYFALVAVVHVDAAERLRRLVELRGMSAEDARARIRAQAGDEQRRAAADVWLDNSGAPGALDPVVDRLWHERLVPFDAALRTATPAPLPAEPVAADPTWAAQARRLAARLRGVGGARVTQVAHIGPGAVEGLAAPDVLELVAVVRTGDDVAAALDDLSAAGVVRSDERLVSADPGRPATIVVRVADDPALESVLLWRDWLRAEPASRTGGAEDLAWEPRARAWAREVGWTLDV